MIEEGALPPFLCVAGVTARTESSPVAVPLPMAAVAVLRRIFVSLTGVAKTARHVDMPSFKTETCRVVVEARRPPGLITMTLPAIFTETCVVTVVLAMAVDAILRGLPIAKPGLVATSTGCTDMSTLQRIVGHGVIEGLHVKAHYICISSFVFGVAGAAVRTACPGCPSVETGRGADVFSHVFVAIETQLVLGARFEAPVAAIALVFDVGVGTDHFTGHEECLEVDSPSGNHKDQTAGAGECGSSE